MASRGQVCYMEVIVCRTCDRNDKQKGDKKIPINKSKLICTATSTSFGAISHVVNQKTTTKHNNTSRAIHSSECPWLLNADWRLQSDAMSTLPSSGPLCATGHSPRALSGNQFRRGGQG